MFTMITVMVMVVMKLVMTLAMARLTNTASLNVPLLKHHRTASAAFASRFCCVCQNGVYFAHMMSMTIVMKQQQQQQ